MPQLIKDRRARGRPLRAGARGGGARRRARRRAGDRSARAVAHGARAPSSPAATSACWLAPDRRSRQRSPPTSAALPVIAVDFPKFTDGRGYSIARLLRDRYGYHGRAARDRRRAARPALRAARNAASTPSRCAPTATPADALASFDDFSERLHGDRRARRSRGSAAARRQHAIGGERRAAHDARRRQPSRCCATSRRATRPRCFASSFGAEDMVLIDLIATHALPIRVFTLDTGRLPEETHALIDRARERYGLPIDVYAPDAPRCCRRFVREHGVNAFYRSVELRKALLRGAQDRAARARAGRPRARGSPACAARNRSRARTLRRSRNSTRCTALPKFNPLADWSDDEVWHYLRAHDVPYNALHDRGYPQHRLRAVHARRRAGRGRPRRPLVVGSSRSTRNAGCTGGRCRSSRKAATRPERGDAVSEPRSTGAAMPARTATTRSRRPMPTTSAGSNRKRSTSCARSPASAATPRCSSPAARIRWCCCASPKRRFGPGRFPFPLLHIDTGHNFPEVIAFRDHRAAELGERLIVRSVEDSIAAGPRRAEAPGREPQRAPVGDAARRDRRVRLRRLHRRRAPRRGKGARQGADLLVPRRVRPVGSEEPAAGAVEPLQRARRIRARTSACFRSATGPSSTSGNTSPASGSRCRRSISRTRGRWSAAARRWSP